jgi:ribonuclease P protein subunit RPR2
MSRRGRGKKRPLVREAARIRIRTLYDISVASAMDGEIQRARYYLELARRIGMRYTVRIPSELKRITCKRCLAPLIPGRTARYRTGKGFQVITCLECGRIKRYSLSSGGKFDEEE